MVTKLPPLGRVAPEDGECEGNGTSRGARLPRSLSDNSSGHRGGQKFTLSARELLRVGQVTAGTLKRAGEWKHDKGHNRRHTARAIAGRRLRLLLLFNRSCLSGSNGSPHAI